MGRRSSCLAWYPSNPHHHYAQPGTVEYPLNQEKWIKRSSVQDDFYPNRKDGFPGYLSDPARFCLFPSALPHLCSFAGARDRPNAGLEKQINRRNANRPYRHLLEIGIPHDFVQVAAVIAAEMSNSFIL